MPQWINREGPMDSYSKLIHCPNESIGRALWPVTQAYVHHLTAHIIMPVPRDGVFVTLVRGINFLRWSPDWRKRTICLQISHLDLHEMVAADVQLFNQVVANPAHVLAPLPLPSKSHSYNLRKRPHDLQIPSYKTNILDENFITRTILALNYTWTELCRITLTSTIVNLLMYCFFLFCPCVLSVTA